MRFGWVAAIGEWPFLTAFPSMVGRGLVASVAVMTEMPCYAMGCNAGRRVDGGHGKGGGAVGSRQTIMKTGRKSAYTWICLVALLARLHLVRSAVLFGPVETYSTDTCILYACFFSEQDRVEILLLTYAPPGFCCCKPPC